LSTSNIEQKINFKDRDYLLGWCALYSFITEKQNTEAITEILGMNEVKLQENVTLQESDGH